jgi:hypothetical protein
MNLVRRISSRGGVTSPLMRANSLMAAVVPITSASCATMEIGQREFVKADQRELRVHATVDDSHGRQVIGGEQRGGPQLVGQRGQRGRANWAALLFELFSF